MPGYGRGVLHVSVVDHGRTASLLRCLATLPAACADIPWRLTVVENVAGTDVAPVRAAIPDAEILVNPRPRGFGANHNRVLRPLLEAADVRYALVLNDDTELDPGSVAALVAFADAHPEVGAVAPSVVDGRGIPQPVLEHFPSPWGEFLSSLARYPAPLDPAGGRQGWLNGACLLLRVDALRQVGIFDERFFLFYEDTDLCARLHAAGWRLAVCADARIVHHAHATVGDPAFGSTMELQIVRSQYLYLRKHHGTVIAELLRIATRAGRGVRALKARRGGGDAALLRELAGYDARRPLPHELP